MNVHTSPPPLRITQTILLLALTVLFLLPTGPAQAYGRAGASLPTSGPASPAWPGQTFRFQHLGLEDGLSQSSINVILQDRRGFLWLGTEDGLNRYDGYTFEVFKPNPDNSSSLSDRWITSLYEDRDGILWVGTRLGGLNRYDPQSGQFTHYEHDASNPNSLSTDKVNALFQDTGCNLWVGTDNGLDWLAPQTGTITHVRMTAEDGVSLDGSAVRSIFQDVRGDVWIGTAGNGPILYRSATHTFEQIWNTVWDKEKICSSYVTAIAETSDGMLWFGTANGLARFHPATNLFTCYRNVSGNSKSLLSNSITALRVDRGDRLWVGTDRGLDQFQPGSNTFLHLTHDPAISDSLSADTIYSIYEDRGGVLWVGTYCGGINKHEQTQNRFAFFRYDPDNPESLGSDFVFPIFADARGNVWVGTYGGGLNRFDPSTGTFTRFTRDPSNPNSLPSDYIYSVFGDSSENLWVSTNKGLSRMALQTGDFTTFSYDAGQHEKNGLEMVNAIAESPNGELWFGTRNGLVRFDRKQEIFYPEQLTSPDAPETLGRVVALHFESSGALWVGTSENGLFRYDAKRGALQQFRADPKGPGSLSNNSVLDIAQTSDGTIWVSTAGGGLNRFNPTTATFKVYTEEDGLPNNVVYGILEDERGRLWLSTNNGLARFDPATETFRNYSVSDGLGSMEFNMSAFAQAPSGAMYFGSTNGLNAFYPDQILDGAYDPPVALTSLTHEGKPLLSGATPEAVQRIELRYPQNSFEFEFAALGFTAARQNQYAYMLEGFDKDWYLLGNKRIGRYTNLPGGTYTLRLKAANSDGMWSAQTINIPVTVIPPFWQTWWFRLSLGLGLVAASIGGYRLRVRRVVNRNRELEDLVRARTVEIEKLFERTKELAVIEERNRLARDLHDSAKQKAFAALAQLGAVNGLARDNSPARKHLVEAENLVAEVIQELTFLIQEMHPAALLEKGLPATIREYVFEWENRNTTKAVVNIESPRRLELKVEQSVYRIIQETLANVARHSEARRVEVSLVYGSDFLRVIVADNGRGFDVGAKMSGLGLRSIRERVESIGGWVTFESESGLGTRVTLEVPIAAEQIIVKEELHEETHIHSHR